MSRGFIIQEWEALQNMTSSPDNASSENIEWASRLIQALWSYSSDIWKGRCNIIHKPNKTTNSSIKLTELKIILLKEVDSLADVATTYDSKDLVTNIRRTYKNAKDINVYKWLDIIRTRKETEQELKKQNESSRQRAQPITTFFRRVARSGEYRLY